MTTTDLEIIPAGEDAAIRTVVEASRAMLPAEGGPVRRGQHAKHHGCVRAEFVIEPDLPEPYRVGLFREPKTFPAWVRFSNGGQSDDRERDAHGMAIKLMGLDPFNSAENGQKATTHDFVLVDHPVFFIPNALDYAHFSTSILKASGLKASFVRGASRFLPTRLAFLLTLVLTYFLPFRIGQLLGLSRFASKRIANPLGSRYWSTTPYRFGDRSAMKFLVVPERIEAGTLDDRSADGLSEAMAKQLRTEGVCFEFQVQLWKDETSTPIEDPTRAWSETIAPPRTLARLIIPPQEFRSPGQMAFCENLSYSPWHALAEHRPLGGINRVRKAVYQVLSETRHGRNHAPQREPRPGDLPDAPTRLAGRPTTFDEVLDAELDLIRARRNHVEGEETPAVREAGEPAGNLDSALMRARVDVLNEHVAGLAFSGGGIRAATFAVGVAQGLATLGLLKRFDYLSTVSGGGYAGSWLAAWMKRDGDPANVEKLLNPNRVAQSHAGREFLNKGNAVDEEAEPLRHLRAYSSYLMPRPGIASVDTWTVLLIWARNVVINLMILFPAAMLLVALARLVISFYGYFNPARVGDDAVDWFVASMILFLGLGLLFLAFERNGRALREFRTGQPERRRSVDSGDVDAVVTRRIVYPALAAAVCLTLSSRWVLARLGSWFDRPPSVVAAAFRSIFGGSPDAPPADLLSDPNGPWRFPLDYLRSHLGLLDVPVFLLHAAFFGVLLALGSFRVANRDRPQGVGPVFLRWASRRRRAARAAAIAGATGGVLLVLLEGLTRWLSEVDRVDLMATFVPPLGVLILVAGLIVEVAILGLEASEGEREWWARLSAMLTLAALTWAGVLATVVYVPGLFLLAGPALRTAIASGWLGSAVFGVITGRYVLPKTGGSRSLTLAASIASQVFLVGLLGVVALLASALTNVPSLFAPHGDIVGPFAYYLEGVKHASIAAIVGLLVGSGILFTMARRLIDVNLFSLHAMYANRLTRAYLGASRAREDWPRRWQGRHDPRVEAGAPGLSKPEGTASPRPRDPNPVTGFDPEDDLDLNTLKVGEAEAGRTYHGPHLLINATLNLVGGAELAWRDRKGESFTLSPLYCGAKSLGYSPTDWAGSALTLGRAVAISGAAVDPNMSFYQSGPLTALLTIFNARLGYWIENPGKADWAARSPRFGSLLFTEFFGRTNRKGDYVHISDGGHFENMGVYELIRRRCRYIVAVDAGDDLDPSDDNLATLIRLCRIDFGVRIKIDTEPLAVSGPDNLSRTHVVIGRIHYDDVDQGELPGVLVYLRASLTGDEPPDIQKYARKEPAFPHQPTDLKQDFDEEQFESYRCLGDHIAREVFHEPVAVVADLIRGRSAADPVHAPATHKEYIPRLFSATQLRWAEPPKQVDEASQPISTGWDALVRDLMTMPALDRLGRELYPELPPTDGRTPDIDPASRDRAELFAISRMLDAAEAAWLSLGARRFSSSPIHRGRLNAFRRWSSTRAFRLSWPTLRGERSAEFVRFCESELHASTSLPTAIRLIAAAAHDSPESRGIAELANEFAREWPGEIGDRIDLDSQSREVFHQTRDLRALIARASTLGLPQSPVWLIEVAPSGLDGAAEPSRRFVAGIILAAPFHDHPDYGTLLTQGEPPVELLAWLRPPHRSSGLATRTARAVIQTIHDELQSVDPGKKPRLWVRYPAVAGDDDLELGLWISFFARYNFRLSYPRNGDAGRPDTLLRQVGGAV